jgi:hypothetical protein
MAVVIYTGTGGNASTIASSYRKLKSLLWLKKENERKNELL